jgi:LPXTG-site transpeptidase (sortase) family protein
VSDHALGSAPRTESRYPGAALPASRRRFVLSTLAAAAFGSALGPALVSARQAIFAPSELSIPGIGLDAMIEQVQIVDGVMEAPDDPWKVGWYSQLSFPGQGANVVMAGHKDWWDIGPAVFWDLTMLESGDEILLTSASGETLVYLVDNVDQLSVATPPSEYTETAGGETLTLITCAGSFDGASYDERLIVRASLQH